jgi:ankyrin repeat protein
VHTAAESGDLPRVRALVDADASLVHQADKSGGTALHRAVIGRSRAVATLLLDRGADLHAVHGAGLGSLSGYAPQDHQPIDLAIWGGPRQMRRPIWRRLAGMARFAWRCAKARAKRPPLVPCDEGLARLLIERGADWDVPTAAALGDADRVRALLDADPSRIHEARPNGRLALSAAVEFGHDAIVRLLLERGADPCWPDSDDSPRGSALHAAARLGNRPMVELLLAHGADPSAYVDAAGNAVFAARTPEIRRLLIDHGGQVDPFDLVWMNEDDEVMRRVLKDPKSAEAGCGGVFTAVVTCGKRDLLTRLLDAGFRVPPVVDGCHSYLIERPDMLRALLASGMSPDTPTSAGRTFLHDLCDRDVRGRTMGRRVEVATMLLDAGAALSPRESESGETPLTWAARNDLPDMVELLLARGAPSSLPEDEPDKTALAWAERRGHVRIAGMLRRAGTRSS